MAPTPAPTTYSYVNNQLDIWPTLLSLPTPDPELSIPSPTFCLLTVAILFPLLSEIQAFSLVFSFLFSFLESVDYSMGIPYFMANIYFYS